MAEAVCAKCARPLEGTNWRWIDGRGYHVGCKPSRDAFKEGKRGGRDLTAFAERKARNVLHGRGQQQLEDGENA